jgi:regulatory protein
MLLRWLSRQAEPEELEALGTEGWVEQLLERYQGSGLLDDLRYARAFVQSQRERGASRRFIEHKLSARRVSLAVIQQALADHAADFSNAELEAATLYARKRRLGPHRPVQERQARRHRDFAALARAGFSFETARSVLGSDLDDPDLF